jgi:hypothetical protein
MILKEQVGKISNATLDGDYLMAISFRIKPNFVMTN